MAKSKSKNPRKARKIPKAKKPGANRQSVLRVMLALLRGDAWDNQVASDASVSVRTVYRIVNDAQVAGFQVWKDDSGKFHAAF